MTGVFGALEPESESTESVTSPRPIPSPPKLSPSLGGLVGVEMGCVVGCADGKDGTATDCAPGEDCADILGEYDAQLAGVPYTLGLPPPPPPPLTGAPIEWCD